MEPSAMDPLAVLSTVAVFGVVVKSVVDGIRRHFPRFDGLWPQLGAWVLGAGAAWAFDLRGAEALLEYVGATTGRVPIAPVDFVITGAAIAAGAGFLAEIAGRSGKTPTIVEVDGEGRPL